MKFIEKKFIELIKDTNPGRDNGNVQRKIIKVFEEIGEVSEAFLNLTSGYNGKNKTWNDLREEIVDVFILIVDISLMTVSPKFLSPIDFENISFDNEQTFEFFEQTFLELISLISDMVKHPYPIVSFIKPNAISILRNSAQLLYIKFPGENYTYEEMNEIIEKELIRKLNKWKDKMAKMAIPRDDI